VIEARCPVCALPAPRSTNHGPVLTPQLLIAAALLLLMASSSRPLLPYTLIQRKEDVRISQNGCVLTLPVPVTLFLL